MPNATDPGSSGSEGPRFWKQLLALVDEGRVVPIVGQDLLTPTVDGERVLLYPYLAERLAEYLEIPSGDLPAEGALHEVACRHLARSGDPLDLYIGLKDVFPSRDRLTLPEPLVQLAEIRPFQLFVTTTFDPLLEQAVNEVRFGGAQRTGVYSQTLTEVLDLEAPEKMSWPAVFHLFGRLSAVPDYAVTEEDTLELVHLLQERSREALEHLFGELSRRHLLLIGSSFPDWLARFFLRIAKGERLWMARGKTEFVAGARSREDDGLASFLQRFSAQTRVFPRGAAELVAGLHQRWTALHPAPAAAPVRAESPAPGSLDMKPGAVFLSYASEDRPVVEALKEELDRAGVDVWFDRDQLTWGDAFEEKIRRNIERCSYFVPLLSRHTLTVERRFFRIEWDEAAKVAVRVKSSLKFILPLVMDGLRPDEEGLPESFRSLQWLPLRDAAIPPDLVTTLKELFREYQRSQPETP
jgi:hypothetical protein